jgi:predicted DNA-binding transcriptional regulator YafY
MALFSWGSKIEIIEPPVLLTEMINRLQATLAHYERSASKAPIPRSS